MDNYQPYAIYLMAEKFVGGREKTTDEDFKLTQDQFINKFESQGFYKIETAGKSRRATAADSGQRHPRMLFLIISETGRYFNKTSDFIRLVQTNKWDEAAVIVPRSFFLKKNFMSKVQELFREGKREGRHLGVYPYAIFTIEIPKHESVPRHRVMDRDEVRQLVEFYHISKSEIPTIYHTDPPVVWCGGRPGDFIAIERDSEAAGKSLTVRLVAEDSSLGADMYSRVL
mgnify:FL=1